MPACDCKSCKDMMKPSNMEKWKFSIIGAVIFLLVANPYTFKLVQCLLGNLIGKIADKNSGCPTMLGLFVHAIVFTILVRYSMELKL